MKKFKKIISAVIMILFIISFKNLYAQKLTIAVAANFRDPMTCIIEKFKEENKGVEIKPVFGSSGNLYNQITHYAPFDVFFSANVSYPQKLYEADLTNGKPEVYAIGQLVLWSKKIDVSAGIEVFKKEKNIRIAIANPELAPYGKSAVECMKHYKIFDELQCKIVIAENIAQTAQFAVSGNVDVGFLAKSQLKMKAIENSGNAFDLPIGTYSPIEQAYVVIKKERNAEISQKFIAFIHKPEIQAIIIDYGYALPK